jgi:hypothetical protein
MHKSQRHRNSFYKRTNPYVINFIRLAQQRKLNRIQQSKIVFVVPDQSFCYIWGL